MLKRRTGHGIDTESDETEGREQRQDETDRREPRHDLGASERLDTAAKVVFGSFATVTTVLAALGATNGGMERMLRNHVLLSFVAFGLLALSIGLAVIALALRSLKAREWALTAAGVVFAVGLVAAVTAAVNTPSTAERPRITASFAHDPVLGMVLHASVDAQGVDAFTEVGIVVDGVQARPDGTYSGVSSLYSGGVGADGSGVVDAELEVPVALGADYSHVAIAATEWVEGQEVTGNRCAHTNAIEGCLIVALPYTTPRPLLTATMSRHGMLSLTLEEQGVPGNQSVVLNVYRDGEREPIYEALVPPTTRGDIELKVDVPVGSTASSYCVAALRIAPAPPPRPVPRPRPSPSAPGNTSSPAGGGDPDTSLEAAETPPRVPCPPDYRLSATWVRLTAGSL